MDTQIEAVARALCAVEGLDPDAVVASTDYAEGLRAGHHPDIPQWQTKAQESARFVAAFNALDTVATSDNPVASTLRAVDARSAVQGTEIGT